VTDSEKQLSLLSPRTRETAQLSAGHSEVERYRKPALHLSETDAAYLAGIIDGEGTISASLSRGLSATLTVGSTCRELVDWLKVTTGVGSLAFKKARKKNHRPLWVWTVSIGSVSSVLSQVVKYLVIKREHALLMLNLLGSKSSVVSKKLTEFKLDAVTKFRKLNQRGLACN
jgi:hypothetical protein